ILVDDIKASKKIIRSLMDDCQRKEESIRKTAKVKLHTGFYYITHYFSEVMHGSLNTFRELEVSIPIYDPAGFVLPLKRIAGRGGVIGLPKSLENLKKSVALRLKKINSMKVQLLEKLSDAVICAGQATLMAENHPVPHQRRVDEELALRFKNKIPRVYSQMIEEVFEYYKKVEHGEIKEIKGEKIDELYSKAQRVYDKMEQFVSSILTR
ncbi:hypothetical protein D6745_01200, partial [Candidatus Woesearchaeota archaeon]